MIGRKSIRFAIALVLALLMLLFWGAAAAQAELKTEVIIHVGESVTVAENQVVNEATAIGASVIVQKHARVTGNALALGGDVVLKAGSQVDGDATAVGGKIIQEEGAVVGGKTVTIPQKIYAMQVMSRWGVWGMLSRIYLLNVAIYIFLLLAVTIIGVVFVLLMPNFIQSITTTINQEPLRSLGFGLGGAIAFLLLTILTGGSLLGAIVIPLSALGLGLAKLLGFVSVGLLLGKNSWLRVRTPISQFLVGMVILAVISLIPIVSGFIFLVFSLFGLGGVLASPWVTEILRGFRYKTRQPINDSKQNHRQEVL